MANHGNYYEPSATEGARFYQYLGPIKGTGRSKSLITLVVSPKADFGDLSGSAYCRNDHLRLTVRLESHPVAVSGEASIEHTYGQNNQTFGHRYAEVAAGGAPGCHVRGLWWR